MVFFQIVHEKPKEHSFEMSQSGSLAALHEQNEILEDEQVNHVHRSARVDLSDVVQRHQTQFKQAEVGFRRRWGIRSGLLATGVFELTRNRI